MKQIVLIEDSANDAALLRRAVDFLGVANPIHHFTNGEDALAHLTNAITIAPIAGPTISIVFVDLVLLGMSGLQILEHMFGKPAFQKTLRIVLTNLSDTATIKRAYSLGANSFLIKPVQTADLRELIKNFPGHWAFTLNQFKPPETPAVVPPVLAK